MARPISFLLVVMMCCAHLHSPAPPLSLLFEGSIVIVCDAKGRPKERGGRDRSHRLEQSSERPHREPTTNAEAGGYTSNFLEVFLRPLWELCFGNRRTTTKTKETSRDNEHEEDVMTRSMFETLCKGKPLSSSSKARPKRRSPETTAARSGGVDPSRTKRSRTGRERWRQRNGECAGDDNDHKRLPYIQRRDDVHNNIL